MMADLKARTDVLRGIFDYTAKRERLDEVNLELEDPNVWNDPAKAQALGRERASLEAVVETIDELDQSLADQTELTEMLLEEGDQDGLVEVDEELEHLETLVAGLEFRRMFSGEADGNNCYLDIQAGSGGTEAQDWANMLLRMYLRWSEKKGFKVEVVEVSEGEVAGSRVRRFMCKVNMPSAGCGQRQGVHRLVRKSPFDSGARRHTSFSSVFASPEIDDNVEIEIDSSDLRIDTYRASGAGGQHVNRTDSAVRITHEPSGIVVQCQSQRSQHQNKDFAMKQLRAKLYEREMDARRAEAQALEDSKADIGWGSQIRSYVLDSSRIKDLRTGVETSNTQSVLDGALDPFIEASLKQGL